MPDLIELTAQPAVVIRLDVAIGSLGAELGRVLPLLQRQVREAGGRPAGPPFTRYIRFAGDGAMEVEAGLPVLEPVIPESPAQFVMLPGGGAASVAHLGPYESLPFSHAVLDEWMEANGRAPGGPRWQVYVTGPGTEADPSRWLTRIFQPLLMR